MNWIKQNWFRLAIIILVLLGGSLAFYWHEWRPTQIVKLCAKVHVGSNTNFRKCLFEHGYPMNLNSNNI